MSMKAFVSFVVLLQINGPNTAEQRNLGWNDYTASLKKTRTLMG